MSDSPVVPSASVDSPTTEFDFVDDSLPKEKKSTFKFDYGAAAKLARSVASSRSSLSKPRRNSVAPSSPPEKKDENSSVGNSFAKDSEEEKDAALSPSQSDVLNDSESEEDDSEEEKSSKKSPTLSIEDVFGPQDTISSDEDSDQPRKKKGHRLRRKTMGKIRLATAVRRAGALDHPQDADDPGFPTFVSPMPKPKKGGRPSHSFILDAETPAKEGHASPVASPSPIASSSPMNSPTSRHSPSSNRQEKASDGVSEDSDDGECYFGMEDDEKSSVLQRSSRGQDPPVVFEDVVALEEGTKEASSGVQVSSVQPSSHEEDLVPTEEDAAEVSSVERSTRGEDPAPLKGDTMEVTSVHSFSRGEDLVPLEVEAFSGPATVEVSTAEDSGVSSPSSTPSTETLQDAIATSQGESKKSKEPIAEDHRDGTVAKEVKSKEDSAPSAIDAKVQPIGSTLCKAVTEKSTSKPSLRIDMLGEASFGHILSFLTPFEGFAFGGALNGSAANQPSCKGQSDPRAACPKQLRSTLLVASREFRARPKAPLTKNLPSVGPALSESILDGGLCFRIRTHPRFKRGALEALEESLSIVISINPPVKAHVLPSSAASPKNGRTISSKTASDTAFPKPLVVRPLSCKKSDASVQKDGAVAKKDGDIDHHNSDYDADQSQFDDATSVDDNSVGIGSDFQGMEESVEGLSTEECLDFLKNRGYGASQEKESEASVNDEMDG